MLKLRDCRLPIRLLKLAILAGCLLGAARSGAGEMSQASMLLISGGTGRNRFRRSDFSVELHKVLVPAGRTGKIVLVDPGSKQMDEIGGVLLAEPASAEVMARVSPPPTLDAAPSSLRIGCEDARSRRSRFEADPSKTNLAAGPDYVRFVRPTNEVWVTEPHASAIEIFSLPEHGLPEPTHAATIRIPNGPESLVIDDAAGRAYTNLWSRPHARDRFAQAQRSSRDGLTDAAVRAGLLSMTRADFSCRMRGRQAGIAPCPATGIAR